VTTAHSILFVADKARSTEFYSRVFGVEPNLNVPGMTEFHIAPGAVLGLMPRDSAKRLFADTVKIAVEGDFHKAAELYLLVDDAAVYLQRAIEAGAREISPLTSRDWGHRAGYCLDLDGHVIAFAQSLSG
jgi:uncharacterized glyoxalase superfamily protein PhnB